jgi:hypothetical protein
VPACAPVAKCSRCFDSPKGIAQAVGMIQKGAELVRPFWRCFGELEFSGIYDEASLMSSWARRSALLASALASASGFRD